MKQPPKPPSERRIMVSIKQRYLIEAGANGHTDLEHYIEALKSECSRLHINLITMQKLVNQQQGLTGLLINKFYKGFR